VRFYLDEDLSQTVAAIARALGLDVISSHECGRDELPDDEQLRLAAQDGRRIVTRNYPDFVRWSRVFHEQQLPRAGVALVPSSLDNHDFSGIARALVAFAEAHADMDMSYTWDYLVPVRE